MIVDDDENALQESPSDEQTTGTEHVVVPTAPTIPFIPYIALSVGCAVGSLPNMSAPLIPTSSDRAMADISVLTVVVLSIG